MTLVALAVGAAACSSADVREDEATSEAEGELRALDATEVVGTITYGTSAMEVQHPGENGGKRIYRAVRFEASAGDEIDTNVIGANAADPVLYLLGSDFRTIKSNDDRAPGDKQPQIKTKLTRGGSYYLAFRTKEGWSTKFYVSLRKTNGAVTPPPPPPPPPPPASWKTALTGFDLWGAQFTAVLPSNSAYFGRKDLFCRIVPSASNISCSWQYDFTDVSATIADDGSFSVSTGTPGNTGGDLSGRIANDGTVTLTNYRRTECFQTSYKWCEGRQTDGQNMPAHATPIQLCRTPDQTFAQGGWASGYYLACSACNGRCEGGK